MNFVGDSNYKARMLMPKLKRIDLEWVVEPAVRKFCGPIFFTRSLETAAGNVIANGSFGLVETGTKKLLVTCFHVWEGFQKARFEEPELKMCLCLDQRNPVVFAPDQPLGADHSLDIVTFDMEPLLGACGPSRKFYSLNQNPAPTVAKGDVLAFIGFPGYLRCVVEGALGFGRQAYVVGAHSADGLHFQLDISRVSKQPDEFPGLSGCPCFKVREGRPLQLVGFATSKWKEFLFFTHARCLNADGTIRNQETRQ